MSLWRQLKPWAAREPETAWVAAAQRGDRRAFDALVHACERPLRGFLARHVPAAAVDDLLQETWLAAWGALPKFQGRSRFKAWLLGIALHKCRDYHRRSGQPAPEPLSPELESDEPGPHEHYAAMELAGQVKTALAALPEMQREVLELYYFAELTLPEIAETLERNLNTVKYQFYRAHARAAECLQDYAPLPDSGVQRPENKKAR